MVSPEVVLREDFCLSIIMKFMILKGVYHDVCVEPGLHPFTGENLTYYIVLL